MLDSGISSRIQKIEVVGQVIFDHLPHHLYLSLVSYLPSLPQLGR